MQNRKPLKNELRLIKFLISIASVDVSDNWEAQLVVKPMNDNGMGSLPLSTDNFADTDRIFMF